MRRRQDVKLKRCPDCREWQCWVDGKRDKHAPNDVCQCGKRKPNPHWRTDGGP